MPTWAAKGKERAHARAVGVQEGDGGADGVVLPLTVTGSGVYDIAYVIQVSVGAKSQTLSLQVDTGSSDLWITSKDCSSSLCGQTNGRTYDASGSKSTGVNFDINYLQGTVSGPIVWDSFVVGGYSIENQALAAATSVSSEPLSPLFSGILGLALPLNSIIAERIPPVTNNAPDGAAWASNLFSVTPVSSAPSSRFISMSLSRPGSDTIPSLLGIGRHPAFITNPQDVKYANLVSERTGTLFWKVGVRAITVWVNGEERAVEIGRSNTGSVFPSAVLDSGVPLILTTTQVANAIYGAIGVAPGSDGQYYIPCTTPLNLTITLDDRPPLSLHPLDLTAEPPRDNQAQFCIGLIQPADAVLTQPNSAIGDMILGVPFLRNVYSVMAYAPPFANGSFPTASSTNGTSDNGDNLEPPAGTIKPRLGLLPLTDPSIALDEFHTVRVLNQPLSSSPSGNSGNTMPGASSGDGAGGSGAGKGGISVGIAVLIGLLGFFALCMGLFGVRWWVYRRRERAGLLDGAPSDEGGHPGGRAGARAGVEEGVLRSVLMNNEGGYGYARGSVVGSRGSRGSASTGMRERDSMSGKEASSKSIMSDKLRARGMDEGDVYRTSRFEPYMQDHGLVDLKGGAQAFIVLDAGAAVKRQSSEEEESDEGREEREMGYRRRSSRIPTRGFGEDEEDPWDPRTAVGRGDEDYWGDETLVAERGKTLGRLGDGEEKVTEDQYPPLPEHERGQSAGVPLLHALGLDDEREHLPGRGPRVNVDEFGVRPTDGDLEAGPGTRTSMAGVGTAVGRGGRKISADAWAMDTLVAREPSRTSAESEAVFTRISGKG
ncbi:hypothetical protein DXG03_004217 [Asterophora parasitica]|uniref:Peptidase A1 domain-containing protein n=1 Tax=Asterophora parasitica TaxID=117018 RepID=A0A9P7G937_9AGAR|nr:hypothetical protein DXG03_004217 [Asterophora parasitica]